MTTIRSRQNQISIHALREEGDIDRIHRLKYFMRNFYPRPPRGGRRVQLVENIVDSEFLSTPSARRATGEISCAPSGRPISIHALREEGDLPVFSRLRCSA